MDDSISDIDLNQTTLSLNRLLEDSDPESPTPQAPKYQITPFPALAVLPPPAPRLVQASDAQDHSELIRSLARRFEVEALGAFSASKEALTADLNAKLEAQHLELTATIRALTEKTTGLNKELVLTKTVANKRLSQLHGLVSIFARIRKAVQHSVLVRGALDAWKRHHVGAYELRVKLRQAARQTKQRTLSQVVGAWRAFAVEEALEKKLEAVRAEVEATKEDEIREFASERDSLVKEINFLKLALKEERDNKDKVQDNLKRLFQRNISNLNLEAMTLLTGTCELDDTLGSRAPSVVMGFTSPPPIKNPYASTMPGRVGSSSIDAHSLSGLPFVNAELNRSFADSLGTPSKPRFQRFVPGTVVGRLNK